MRQRRTHSASTKLREDYESYRWDHHLAPDTIGTITGGELRDVLLSLWSSAPCAVAKALALELPIDADSHDRIEREVQARLPGHWPEQAS